MAKETKMQGRINTFLNDASRLADFLDALTSGLYMREACALVGVSTQTVYSTLRTGKIDLKAHREDTPEAQFAINVQQAMATAERDSLTRIRTASAINPAFWAADAWFLERRYPEKYGRKDRVAMEHSGDVGFSVTAKIDLREVSGDVADAILSHASTVATGPVGGSTGSRDDYFPGDDPDAQALEDSE